MRFPALILGSGGHAKVLVDTLLASGTPILGMLDPSPARLGAELWGVKVIGGDSLIADYAPNSVRLVNGLGSVASTESRRLLFERFKRQDYIFMQVIHPSAIISQHAELEEGAQIMAGAVIQAGSRIGRNVLVNTGALVDHDCVLGDHVHIAPGVTLSGGVQIDGGAHIGTGAILKQGVHVGECSCIGAGSVVIRDVPAGSTVVGVPAKEIAR